MTLYKHLVYVDFVSFIMQSWNCYLKDTWEFYPTLDLAKNNLWIGYRLHSPEKNKIEMLVFKHIRNRFDFSKTKDFMFQRLVSEHKQRPSSKCAIPEKIQNSRESKTSPLDIPHSCVAHLENSEWKTKTNGNMAWFFFPLLEIPLLF